MAGLVHHYYLWVLALAAHVRIRTELIFQEVACENPVRVHWWRPGQRDRVLLYISDPESRIFLRDCGGRGGNTHSKQLYSATQFPWLLLDFPFSSCESILSMLVLHNPTSLWGFEVDGMAAGAIAPPVEGHDDETVLRKGRESWYRGMVPVPGDCQRLLVSVTFL